MDQLRVARSINIVREAFDGSVANVPPSTPPLSHQSSQVSIVARLGVAASSSAPWSRSQRIFVAEKYESSTRPVVETNERSVAGPLEFFAVGRRASVLPDNGAGDVVAVARSKATVVSR